MRMSDCKSVDDILIEFAKRDPSGYVVWGQKILVAHNRECEQLNTEIDAMSKFNDALNAQMKELAAECERLRAALKPVLKLEDNYDGHWPFASLAVDAVKEAQKIYKEVTK